MCMYVYELNVFRVCTKDSERNYVQFAGGRSSRAQKKTERGVDCILLFACEIYLKGSKYLTQFAVRNQLRFLINFL